MQNWDTDEYRRAARIREDLVVEHDTDRDRGGAPFLLMRFDGGKSSGQALAEVDA